jgi:thioredoxin 1
MPSKNVLAINDLNFVHEVLESAEPFLLEFTAKWCGPCRTLAPIVERIADDSLGRVRVGAIDIDESPAVTAKLRVRGAPTVVVFKSGAERTRQLGVTSRQRLLAMIDD